MFINGFRVRYELPVHAQPATRERPESDSLNPGDFERDGAGHLRSKTSHTLNAVPCYIYTPGNDSLALDPHVQDPGIANIAATTLQLLGFERPEGYVPSLLA